MSVLSASQQELQRQNAARVASPSKVRPLPPFPAIFAPLRARFPEMADSLDEVEKNIAEWVKTLQNS